MKRKLNRPIFILVVLSGIMIGVCAISFINALTWVHKPFPGFLIYEPPYVGSISVRGWPGRTLGLSFMDRVLTVDGESVQKGEDVVDKVREKKPGTPVHYTIESKEGVKEVTVPVTLFGLKDFFLAFFVTFLGGFMLFLLGVIVVLFKPAKSISWVFFTLCFSLSSYMVTSFEILSTYFFVRFHYTALSVFPIAFFHLALTFPDRRKILDRFPALEYLIYLPAILLTLGYQIYFSAFTHVLGAGSSTWIPSYKLLGSIARLFMLISVLSLIVFVFHSVYKASSVMARQRARMILFGVTIAFLPPLILTLLSFFVKFSFPWNFLVFFIIFFPASIAYSIVRHNLFDADEIIKRTVGYVAVTGVVVGAYAVVSLGLNMVMGQYQIAQSRLFPIIFTLGVILVFNPLRNRIQALVDRLFFRKEYDYGTIVDKVGGAMTSLLDLGKILKHLTQTFTEDMFINTSSVMLRTPEGTAYKVFLADGEKKEAVEKVVIQRDDPLMGVIEDEKKELTKFDVLEDPKYGKISEWCARGFEGLYASLMVPLVFQDEVIGSLNLGEKKSGKAYNRKDIDLVRTLASQGAVAIENAKLFQENLEKQRMEEELAIGRDLQMSMLPATCPEVTGFDIAAFSTPAMEVGGDFFDFIEIDEGRIGMVVGDVTGKSVSGALVMSSARSVFRMLSEEPLGVAEIMTRANRRLKRDIKTGMFVALLYAVLDAEGRVLSLCSAGQTQPIRLSAETGEASLVGTEGDTFPLGILDEADYQETRLELMLGDRVVLYTDGIVEAMNPDKEMFGFERLLEVVSGAKELDSEALLKEIMDRVNAFAGDAPQHDDLTVIVLHAEE